MRLQANYLILLVLSLLIPVVGQANDCGSLVTNYGPYDFRSDKANLPVVEHSHFTDVTFRMAINGTKSVSKYFKAFKFGSMGTATIKGTPLPEDLDYTLRAFPNHPKALYAMSEYQRIAGTPTALESYDLIHYRTSSCYFKRAIQFSSADPAVYFVYGIYFHKRKKYSIALEQYKKSEKLDNSNVELLYNIGLVYTDLGEMKKAKKYSDNVYARGYPLNGLKLRVEKGHK